MKQHWLNRKTAVQMLVACLAVGGCEKARLDEQVRTLCAKDGGIKVYETVRLPSDKFNQWGQPNFYKPTQGENALGSEYLLNKERYYYKRGNPEMSRLHIAIVRRIDGKVLGESVSYGRGGGDLPGPWHDSSFSCPDEYGDIPLLSRVFVQADGDKP